MTRKNKYYSLKQILFENDYSNKKMASTVGHLKIKTLKAKTFFIFNVSKSSEYQYKLVVV
jgi:hypothetical protein